jgi:hypothetical protein
MKIRTILLCSVFLAAGCLQAQSKTYPNRWVYFSTALSSNQQVEDFRKMAQIASEHGITAILLSAGFDELDIAPVEYVERLKRVKAVADQFHLELVPLAFSAGYGGAVLAHDKNLAAGLPVVDAPYVVNDGEANLVSELTPKVVNAGFEQHDGGKPVGFRPDEKSGDVFVVDTKVLHGGQSSLRIDIPKAIDGNARTYQEFAVNPNRQYRLTCWVKTEDIEPVDPLRLDMLAEDGRNLNPWEPRLHKSGAWAELTAGFNSLGAHKVKLSLGVEDAKAGRIWVDDVKIEEVGLTNVLRRAGTPVTVRGETSATTYEEGRDYAPITDSKLNYRYDHNGPAIRILPGSRIKNGERLRVSYYQATTIYKEQVVLCLSEPKVFEIWRNQTRLIQKYLAPAKWMLSMDEIRAGGWCETCKRRHMSLAQILGDAIRRQEEMIREVSPKAEVFIWSDMLDPNHNATPGTYYLCNGGYDGSWNYIPKDLRIVCWYFERRRKSLEHFSSLGFQTLAGAYYDADNLDNPKGWLESLDSTPGATGIMYTTWQAKYKLLADFGDLAIKGR